MANRVSATADNDREESANGGKVYRPQLLWPRFSIAGDGFDENDAFAFFECKRTVQENRRCFSKILEKQGFFAGSNTFWECFRLSTNILFADKFFQEASYKRMRWELQEAFKARDKTRKHIRVYCSENFDKINRLHRKCEEENAEVFGLFAVEIKRLVVFEPKRIVGREVQPMGER